MEVLQALIMQPHYVILDEIDTGVDVDSIGIISQALAQLRVTHPQTTLILITHYARIFTHLSVDETIVLHRGTIARRGDASLVKTIDANGYGTLTA